MSKWRVNTFRVTLTLPKELKETLQRIAKSENRSISNYVLTAVKEKLIRDKHLKD